jgi:hypothetical protein
MLPVLLLCRSPLPVRTHITIGTSEALEREWSQNQLFSNLIDRCLADRYSAAKYSTYAHNAYRNNA